jgi:prenyltransferase beta subunit
VKRPLYLLLLVGILAAPAGGQTADEKKATIAYVQALQQPDGGFVAARTLAKSPSSLRATSSALRALKYWGGEPKDRAAAARFIEKCHDKASGGFADAPGGKPDVFTTAVGIMAATETKVPAELYSAGAVKYLAENAKSFDDIRIAVAGLERIEKPSPKAEQWRKQVAALLNPDGTAGKGDGAARETGSVVVALLRLGGKVENREAVLKTLKVGQRSDGGFGKEGAKESDPESSYRILRCFHMLKGKPEAPDKLRAFVAKCRNSDGGYGVAPDQPSTVAGTYFASITLHWLDEK